MNWEQYGDDSFLLYLACGHSVVRYFVGVPAEHDCKLCDRYLKHLKARLAKENIG